MHIMDWDHKFSSIVKETESNLARVKEQLGSSRSPNNAVLNNGMLESTWAMRGNDFAAHTINGFGSSGYPGLTISKLATPSVGSANKDSPYLPVEQSPGVVLVLQDRLDEQAKAIESLTKSVRRLEDERDGYQRIIKDLREEVNTVLCRLSERGVDLHTERKLEQWRRDVANEMHVLQNQVQLYRGREADSGNVDSMAFSTELHEVRRFMQEEVESFRRDIDLFKNRLAKLELGMTGIDTDNKDVNRRQERLDRNIRDILDSQQVASHDLTRTKGDLHQEKEEITQLRNNYRNLTEKLGFLESRIHVSVEGSQKRSAKKPHTHRRIRPTHAFIPKAAPSPTTSDLDLDLELTTDSEFDLLESVNASNLTTNLKARPITVQNDPGSDDDYLLTDLNLSGEDLSSEGDTLGLDDMH